MGLYVEKTVKNPGRKKRGRETTKLEDDDKNVYVNLDDGTSV